MNGLFPIMLAHGEHVILLVLGLLLIVYPVALWVLLNSGAAKPNRSIISCAVAIIVVCGLGALATLKDFTWPSDWNGYVGFLIWVLPLACGIIAIIRTRRTNHA